MAIRTSQRRATAFVSAALGALCLQLAVANSASAQCVGDCNGDGEVAINELITGVNIALGTQDVSACPAFANEANEVNIAQLIKGVNNALNGCPDEPTPTPTTEESATETPTVIPTETATPGGDEIGTRECTLTGGATASRVKLNAGTLPLPPFPMSGTVSVTCGSVQDGEAPCECNVVNLNPINIPGIGFVCISPAEEPCDSGSIDCDGGTVLGVAVEANGNIGACDGNDSCAQQCDAHCAGLGLTTAVPPACTGYCNGGERDGLSCNCDTATPGRCSGEDCPGGACNGPDPAQAVADICQCQCIDRAAGEEQRPGEMACNLPTRLIVERGAPCGDGDLLINVGTACAPLTTSVASTVINNANFITDNIVPAGPCENDEGIEQPGVLCTNSSNCLNPEFPICGAGPVAANGAPVTCEALRTSASGLKLRGMLNFFGSSLGDLASELYVDCE